MAEKKFKGVIKLDIRDSAREQAERLFELMNAQQR